MVLEQHAARAAVLFNKLLTARGVTATYRKIGTPVTDLETGILTPTVLETASPKVLRATQETIETVLGASRTTEVTTMPWELAVSAVNGPVTPQDELDVGGVVYEVLRAQKDQLEIRWIVESRERA